MTVISIILTVLAIGGIGFVYLAITKLKDSIMSAADDIRREITELTEAQQAVVALVNTNADALATVKAQLAEALAKLDLAEEQLAEFNGIAGQLDTIEQGLRSVLPAPETPVDPQPETPPDDGGSPEPDAPTGEQPAEGTVTVEDGQVTPQTPAAAP